MHESAKRVLVKTEANLLEMEISLKIPGGGAERQRGFRGEMLGVVLAAVQLKCRGENISAKMQNKSRTTVKWGQPFPVSELESPRKFE